MEKKRKLVWILLFIPILVTIWLFSLERYFYWLIFIVTVIIVKFYKPTSKKIMLYGFISFFVGILFTIINNLLIAEFVMRISFVFWLIGLVLAMRESSIKKNPNIS